MVSKGLTQNRCVVTNATIRGRVEVRPEPSIRELARRTEVRNGKPMWGRDFI